MLLDFAIQSSIDAADWDEAWRYCDAELVQQLQLLRQQAADCEMNFYLTSIDAALTRLGQTSA